MTKNRSQQEGPCRADASLQEAPVLFDAGGIGAGTVGLPVAGHEAFLSISLCVMVGRSGPVVGSVGPVLPSGARISIELSAGLLTCDLAGEAIESANIASQML